MDPSEIIPEELRERGDDRNGTEPTPPPPPLMDEPPLRAADAAMRRVIAELDLKMQASQAMLTMLVVATVLVLIELEAIRRANG